MVTLSGLNWRRVDDIGAIRYEPVPLSRMNPIFVTHYAINWRRLSNVKDSVGGPSGT